jgi:hypothetical protein
MPTILTRAAVSLKSLGFAGSSASSPSVFLTNSLRTRNAASSSTSYLSRTPGSASNQSTWTFSAWVKRGGNLGQYQYILTAGSGSPYVTLGFDNNNKLQFILNAGSSSTGLLTTSVYTDTTAWYHIVANIDTTQATAANRISLYVNGVQPAAYDIANYPTQNSTWKVNAAGYHGISGSQYIESFDGYITDVYFVDGQQLPASSFGSTNATTGQWSPKAYTGTYGTNGYHLTFSNTASTTTLGYDTSGNSNHWVTTNISLTSGYTYDSITDVPVAYSATAANYAVLNPFNSSGVTLSKGNLDCLATATGRGFGTISMKAVDAVNWYWEMTPIVATGAYNNHVGIYADNIDPTTDANRIVWRNDGAVYTNGSLSGTIASYTVGDTVAMAFNSTTRSLTYYKNGTSLGSFTATDPGTGGGFFPHILQNSGAEIAVNFGQQGFKYTPPSGYLALNTYNLPSPTIAQGNKYMDATTYSGNSSTQNIANAGGFRPDLVWIKSRSGAFDNNIFDSVRPSGYVLCSNNTSGDSTDYSAYFTGINSNGFALASSTLMNSSSYTYVGWQWQAGAGSSSTNTNGSITSTVSANTTSGFSIVSYTGTGPGNFTVGHGLGVAPSMIIMKNRDRAVYWIVYTATTGINNFLRLNTTDISTAGTGIWGTSAPTSTVFGGAGTDASNGYVAGEKIVAYCFAPIAGFSAFGSYVGNGTANTGPFVYTGFRPRFIMTKAATSTGDWMVWDTARDPVNQAHRALIWNSSNAEISNDPYSNFSILSNGFRLEESVSSPSYGNNISGVTYVYAAFAENPFKYSLAR